jgi:hypothetical protein
MTINHILSISVSRSLGSGLGRDLDLGIQPSPPFGPATGLVWDLLFCGAIATMGRGPASGESPRTHNNKMRIGTVATTL